MRYFNGCQLSKKKWHPVISVEELDEESAPRAFGESFLKKSRGVWGKLWTKNRHPVHSESRFSKKLHLKESPESFGRTNRTLYTRSLSLKNRLPEEPVAEVGRKSA